MFQSQAPQIYPIYPLFYPILPPQFHPLTYPTIPAQSYPLYNPVLRSFYYPPPSVMAMNQHLVPSVQEEIQEGNTTSPGTPPEGGCGDDGCENTPQAHATDVLTLVCPEQHMAPVAAESEPEPQPTSRLPPEIVGIEEPLSSRPPSPKELTWGEIMDLADPVPSSPSTPTLLPWEENLDGEGSERSTSPSLTSLSWGEMMDDVDPIPSRPLTPTLLPWGKRLDEADAQLEGLKKDEGKVDNILEEKVKGLAVREQNRGTKLFEEPKKHAPEKTNKLPSSNSENTQGVQLYIRDLDHSVDSRRLLKEFLPFGNITKAKVVMENGRSKGFGFVTYQTMTEATTAIREMNGKMLGWKPLFVALSRSKEERQSCPARESRRPGAAFCSRPGRVRTETNRGSSLTVVAQLHRHILVGNEKDFKK